MDIRPVTLEGLHVRLEPLTLRHVAAFGEAGREWNLTPEKIRDGIESALRQQAVGTCLPFATLDKSSGQVVGGTRFLNIVPEQRRLEIGSSWIAQPWRRTAINTEAKFLMLEHAFERLGCIRVEFMADSRNEISRKAILRLGAKEEGTFRNYIVTADGETHDAVFYSIIESEWPVIRARLQGMLARRYEAIELSKS
ncbi:MAG: N-acetyltransferase [Acidobacteriota bacterium]|jgi:RimJ/RimL family protein N-acetyltransferase|nr:N-acetyltransferase [Acidobacteriota bacterium]MDT7779604.1 N-acetyltransferase [Acidobacteriota bacterium]